MHRHLKRIALRTSLYYWLVAALWIWLSDAVVELAATNIALIHRYQSYKGWFFVSLTAIGLYFTLRGQLSRWEKEVEERKRVALALAESQQKFKLLTENLPQLIWTCDPQGMTDYYAPQWEAYTGRPLAEQMGLGWLALIHPDDKEQLQAKWRKAVETGEHYEHEFRIRRHDGIYRWFFTRAVPLRNEAGVVFKWIGTNIDIQELHETREELSKRAEHLRLATEAAQMGTWERDLTSNKLFWSPAMEKIMGFAPGTFPGTIEAFNQLIAPESHADLERARQEAFSNGGKYQVELHLNLPDGTQRDALIRGQYFYDNAGIPIRSVGVDLDITKLKQAEQKIYQQKAQLEAVFESIHDSIYVADMDAKILLMNQAGRKILQTLSVPIESALDNITALLQKYDYFDLSGAPLQREQLPIYRVLCGEAFSDLELKVIDRDAGTRRFISFSGVPVYDAENKQILCVVRSRNITKTKLAETALRESEDRFRALFEESATGNLIVELKNHTVVDCNAAATKIFGWTKTELIGKQIADLEAKFSPAELQGLFEQVRNHQLQQFETTTNTKSGEQRNVLIATRNIVINGEEFVHASHLDITEMKRTEAALQKERSRFEKLAAASPSVIHSFKVTADGKVSFPYASPAIKEIYGVTPEVLKTDGAIIVSMWHPDDIDRVNKSVEISLQTMTPWHEKWRIIHPQKGEIWVEGHSMPTAEPDGSIVWHGVLSDITEQKRSEIALQESEARLRVLSNISRNLSQVGPNFNAVRSQIVQTINETLNDFCAICLLSEDEKHLETTGLFHPVTEVQEFLSSQLSDGTYALSEAPIDRVVIETGEAAFLPNVQKSFLASMVHKRYLPVLEHINFLSFILAPMRNEGKVSGLICVGRTTKTREFDLHDLQFVQEIADRAALALRNAQLYDQVQKELVKRQKVEISLRQEKERFEATAAIAPGVLYSCRLDQQNNFSYPYASANLPRLLGEDTTADGSITVQKVFALIHPDDQPQIRQSALTSARDLTPWHQSWRMQISGGGERWIEGHSIPAREADGSTIWHGVLIDVTEQKLQQRALAASEKMLRAINNASPNIIILWDVATASMDYANAGVQTILGYSLAEVQKMNFQAVFKVYHPDDKQRTLSFLHQLSKMEEGKLLSQEYRVRHKDGSWRTLLSRDAVFARNQNGNATKILSITEDITARKQAEENLVQSYEQLRELTQKLQTVREEERCYLARELHDEIGQLMTGLKYLLEIIGLATETLQLKPVAEAQELANSVLLKVRQLSLDLRPGMLDDLGLVPAILWHCNRFRAQTNIVVQFTHAGIEGKRFGMETETAAYRIVQEALTNIARHAQCKEASVHLWIDHQMMNIQIQDHGTGFDAVAIASSSDSSGLVGMRERAIILGGTFVIESEPNCGTTIFATIPLR